jgi:large repetitive protein
MNSNNMQTRSIGKIILCTLLMMQLAVQSTFSQTTITDGPGGPILVISSTSNPFSTYPAEMLRAEGWNAFKVLDISAVTSTVLNSYDAVILGDISLTAAQVTMLTNWTTAGGTLIAFGPDPQLASLMGITATGGTLSDAYLYVNQSSAPGKGIVAQTIQFHGSADLYTANSGTTVVATLFSSATTATSNPAVTMRSVGTAGGLAVAFTYDLAKSIVYTRQGNPAWAAQKRDGQAFPIRSDDMFYPNWVDLNKVAIPQADEQQHLLSNIIVTGNTDKKPLPRLWFLPKGLKAAVVETGDDHDYGQSYARFDQYLAYSKDNSAAAVANWTALRNTAYIYPPGNGFTDASLAQYQSQGFEVALHLNTQCAVWTAAQWASYWDTQWAQLKANFPSINTPVTNRTHCISWSDWATQPKLESARGIRLDCNYYYWPGAWIQDRPGMFTGSGVPMRFADLDGTLIDCYQVTTQMTDESGQTYSKTITALFPAPTPSSKPHWPATSR